MEALDHPDIHSNSDATPRQILIDTILNEMKGQTADDTPINSDKLSLSVPLSKMEDLDRFREDEIIKNKDHIREVVNDITSSVQIITTAQETLTAASELGIEALKKLGENPKAKLKTRYKGVGDTSDVMLDTDKSQKRIVLSGDRGFATLTALAGGMRRVILWNSGFYLTLRNIPLINLNAYYREVSHQDYEYGKQFGGYYYLFSHLTITEYIIQHLFPLMICGSNYADWQNQDKLLQAISMQDYPSILHAAGCMLHPGGAPVSFVCAHEGCGYIHTENSDLSKLRLINTDLLKPEMMETFKKPGFLTDEDLQEFKKNTTYLEDKFDVEYEMGLQKRKWRFYCKQCSLFDYVAVGRDYNAELRKNCSPTDEMEVSQYTNYNIYRSFKPWIQAVALIQDVDGTERELVVENDNTAASNKMIYLILDEMQQYCPDLDEIFRDYILRTRISHLAFYMPTCPKCGHEPANSWHGYIPYEPMQAFFTLALIKLLQGANRATSKNSKQDTQAS